MSNQSTTAIIKANEKIINQLEKIKQNLNKLKNTTVTATVNLKDKISTSLNKITQKINKLNNKKITTIFKADDRVTNKLNRITQKISKVKAKSITIGVEAKDKTSKGQKSSGKVKGFIQNRGQNIVNFAKQSITAAQSQAANEIKLASTLKLRTKASKEQINSVLKLTSAQQQNGVVSNEVQMAGAGQLAAYAGNTKNIQTLIPAMNNLLVSQKGLNGTSDDAAQVADLMGQGLKGETDGLKQAGLSFSEAQEKVLKYGTEEERAATLANVIADNVGNANEEMTNTDVGAIKQAQNLFGQLSGQIGSMVMPYLVKFAKWFSEHEPQIKAIVGTLVGAILGAINKIFEFFKKHPEVAQFISEMLGKFKEFGAYLATVIPPILKQLSQWFTTTILPVLEQIGGSLLNLWNNVILPFINTVFPIIKQGVISCFAIIGGVIEGALQIFHGIIDFVTGVFTGDWSTAWQGVVAIFDGIFSGIAAILEVPLNAVIGLINSAIKKINSSIQFDFPEWVPKYGGKHFGLNIPEIKPFQAASQKGQKNPKTEGKKEDGNALGTPYWKGGLTHINERGGEIVDLPNGSRVIPADKSERMMSSGSVSFGNIYITAKGVTANEVANEIVPLLKLKLANI